VKLLTIQGVLLGLFVGAAVGIGAYTFAYAKGLIDLINDLKAAKAASKSDTELATAQNFQRKAQFYLDFVEAENSTGFHAPQEAARILGESINFSRQGQIALRPGPGTGQQQVAKGQ
jgi:nitrite reductase (cytochrome c-552)